MSIYKDTLSIQIHKENSMSQEKLTKLLESVDRALRSKSTENPWDEYVPVISKGNDHTVFLTEAFADPSMYNKLCYCLMNASEEDQFKLVINSLGGTLDSAFMITDAIVKSKAHVTAYLAGTVASAATIIALSCDTLETTDNLSFMIHNYSSSGMQGKGHEMKARQTFIDKELNKSFNRYYKGFLSQQEIEDVIEGKDIWLNSEEVMQRWHKRQEDTSLLKKAS